MGGRRSRSTGSRFVQDRGARGARREGRKARSEGGRCCHVRTRADVNCKTARGKAENSQRSELKVLQTAFGLGSNRSDSTAHVHRVAPPSNRRVCVDSNPRTHLLEVGPPRSSKQVAPSRRSVDKRAIPSRVWTRKKGGRDATNAPVRPYVLLLLLLAAAVITVVVAVDPTGPFHLRAPTRFGPFERVEQGRLSSFDHVECEVSECRVAVGESCR